MLVSGHWNFVFLVQSWIFVTESCWFLALQLINFCQFLPHFRSTTCPFSKYVCMGQIIKFPRAKRKQGKKIDEFFVQKLPDYQQHCDLGDINFTCATCGNLTHFSFRGIIFRELNFYCSSCGVGYKLNNPLFGSGSKSKAT